MNAVAVEVSPRELVPQMLELRAQGLKSPEIAAHLGLSSSTVRNWWAGETCSGCGVYIERLARTKFWTRDAIIDAIRRFAAANGRPPVAAEWIRADHTNGYPATGQCYRHRGNKNGPFAKWADAIEAAGFPRPHTGIYQIKQRPAACRTPDAETSEAASTRKGTGS